MQSENNKGFFGNLKYDLPSSLVVFLVALPLCLGIALASGAPLFSGIISGIIGGIVVSLISRSPLGISGPAAGLAVIVLNAIQDLGSFEIFLSAVVIAGVMQVALGLLKAGVIGYYFPSAVIKGMLSGIGIIIILKQIPHALGYDKDPEGDFEFSQSDGQNTLSELANIIDYVTPGAIIITLVSLAILILWERPFMKKLPTSRLIQGPLLAVLAGIGLNMLFKNMEGLALDPEHSVNVPVADSLKGFILQFTLPDFSQWNNPHLYLVAGTIAVVASLETLLSVEAIDKLDPQKRITPTNRELLAQGVGNMVSGLIGGIPITQVIVRSSANVQSGGRSRASSFLHGILLLGCAMAIPKVLNLIPLASLAAILLLVGYKLAKPSLFKAMYRKGMGQFIPFVVTILGLVFTDLLIGIALGLVVAIVQILWNNYKVPYHFDAEAYQPGEPVQIQLSEDVSFLNKASILRTLEILPKGAEVIIDASKSRNIHPDIIEIIDDFEVKARPWGTRVHFVGWNEQKAPNMMARVRAEFEEMGQE
ncbi:MAG: SulP family inorganic anion transporter [Bacteroidia bacterium]|nr:SulP family inorganic anion transporter [Bacteroidia bacterium]